MDSTRGKLGKGDMEGKRVGRERTRGCGTVGRGRKRAESRARECNYFRVELARGTGCYGQEWSKRRDAGGTKREENGTAQKNSRKFSRMDRKITGGWMSPT